MPIKNQLIRFWLIWGSLALATSVIAIWLWLVDTAMDHGRYEQPTDLPFYWLGGLTLMIIMTVSLGRGVRFFSQHTEKGLGTSTTT
ncbi:MAG: hypothetical protein Q8P13_02610 [bacterium]|nr:hypothetical protein [bacterium]